MDAALQRPLSGMAADVDSPHLHRWVRLALLAAAGLGCGISPAFFGYFNLSLWGPIAIGATVLATALLVARQDIPRGPAAAAVLGLLAFAVWCLLSISWAESGDQALTEGDRWILYGVFLLVLLLLIADLRDAQLFLAASVAGILCIGAYDLARMLSGEGRALFSGSRLLEPLGYVNGLGGFFLLGFWPLLAVAERVRRPALAGAAAGSATIIAALVLFTASRGTVFAFVVSALVLLTFLPGRNRRAWAILAVLAGLLAAWGPLTDVTREMPGSIAPPSAGTIRHGAQWALLSGVGVAVIWGLATWLVGLLTARAKVGLQRLSRASVALLSAIAIFAVAGAAVTLNDPIGRVSAQYEAFTKLEPVRGPSRFTSGGGNRYDYWRIGWNQFANHPLEGVGAGNFDSTYFRERRTNENVRQAHSIELQTLGETGLVGAALLGAFFVATFLGARRCAAAIRRHEMNAGIVIATLGIFVVWLAQTSVDWLHLIPGVTGIALGAAAILLRRPSAESSTGAEFMRFPPLALIALMPLAAVAILLIGRPTMAAYLRSEVGAKLPTDPKAALTDVDESLSLNPDSMQGYYLKAASFARLHAFQPAKLSLLEAIEREPHNYVSWALLGDLLTRRGAILAAMHAYRHAGLLNPRDRELKLLGSRHKLVEARHDHPSRPGVALQ